MGLPTELWIYEILPHIPLYCYDTMALVNKSISTYVMSHSNELIEQYERCCAKSSIQNNMRFKKLIRNAIHKNYHLPFLRFIKKYHTLPEPEYTLRLIIKQKKNKILELFQSIYLKLPKEIHKILVSDINRYIYTNNLKGVRFIRNKYGPKVLKDKLQYARTSEMRDFIKAFC